MEVVVVLGVTPFCFEDGHVLKERATSMFRTVCQTVWRFVATTAVFANLKSHFEDFSKAVYR
jgi:hypothetical protein